MINPSSDLYTRGAAITPSDTANEAAVFDGIHVGGAGTMVVVFADGTTATLVGCLAGHVYRVRGIRVNSTSTTATNLVGLRFA